uniref:Thiol:disulfide interchange protein, thioredoxin family n=1 Tax=Chlorobium chlorochromatii (strain CaD3) TaxID=340177 RepID=Q3AP99_CHLCH
MKHSTLFIAALAIVTGGTIAQNNTLNAAPPTAKQSVKGATAPTFTAKSVQGHIVSSQQLAGKPYIVNFFGSWCPYCRKEIPDMIALQERYKAQGFTFIGAAYQDNENAMPDFIWEHNINYPVIMADSKIINSFAPYIAGGIRSVPLLFAIGRDGKIVAVEPGAQTREDLEKLIQKLLQRPAKR